MIIRAPVDGSDGNKAVRAGLVPARAGTLSCHAIKGRDKPVPYGPLRPWPCSPKALSSPRETPARAGCLKLTVAV